ncbi:MAG: hypothetical protein LBH39_00040 [Clostridiales Family XIII bacterium]|jgi:hypothetical protein|nr:hypothetical protein [Clostridiales Family XIII bacterium]
MKKFGSIIALIMLSLFLSTSVCSAASLNLLRNYPEDGSTSSFPVNLGIKLFFDADISSTELLKRVNQTCFTLTSKDDGETVPVSVFFPDNDNKYILVVAEPEDQTAGLGSARSYTLTIDEKLRSRNGARLGEMREINFSTRDASADMKVNMAMMAVMFVGMIAFSSISMRRQMKKASEADTNAKVNPYKVAKETGKNVVDIVEQDEKRKKKAAAAKAAGQQPKSKSAAPSQKEDKYAGKRVKRVSRPRPISEGGGTYLSGRKALAEQMAREEAERRAKGTTKPKKSGGSRKKKK